MWKSRNWCVLLLTIALGACSSIPTQYPKTASTALTDTEATFLGQRVAARGNPGDGRSGLYLLTDGSEALAARLILTQRAEKTIDAQYYLIHDDVAGHLFAGQLLKAADRGVRVRLLIDDIQASGYDAMTAALDDHPNIEIRLFNPFSRNAKALNALFDFSRINRRMHNKSMTFDNQVTIVGGRNIGAEYFEANEDSNYDDLDVLGAGPVAKDVSASFDDYWNSPYAVPVQFAATPRSAAMTPEWARTRLSELADAAAKTEYGAALTHEFGNTIEQAALPLSWVPATVVADPPQKAAGDLEGLPIVTSVMRPYLLAAEQDLFVVSAYFVPRKRGEEFLAGLVEQGVDVTILTNSLDSTDVLPVHGHYACSRKELLQAGVDLWELRPDRLRMDRKRLGLGLSRSGLHAKAFAIDRRYLFVGSVNWDPRSANINTEMGILLDAPELTGRVIGNFETRLAHQAYHLVLDDDGKINWLALEADGTTRTYRNEPTDSDWRLFGSHLYGIMPIGSQL